MTERRIDVLIAGAGFAGLSLACALRQALGDAFVVMVADPALSIDGAPSTDPRASAIAAAARRLLAAIGVWDKVAADAQPILDMAITDSRVDDAVRPTFLTFAGELEEAEPFAHMVENRRVIAALTAQARTDGVLLRAASVQSFERAAARIAMQLADGTSVAARLLVAADGARSRIRETAGIASVGWSYGQSAIVTTVAHERDHEGRATEHFLPAGPFASLPLPGRRSSIVWTEERAEAERLVALPDVEFHAELERRFGLELGEIELAGPRRAYPLGFSLARSFVSERIALIGDAAHVIHPIAGQGLNMGLRDVAALAEALVDAARLGLDPGGNATLDRYQRWRRFDSLAMGVATDGLNRLFSNRSTLLKAARDFGLGMVDRLPALKQLFIREAAGLTGEVPKLLKGEAL
jgi:2-octaprenyl-6-methoxyphenol hydroxylase